MLDELVSSLLYEGYALYPYTPGAIKNATPTPFGIVYPPAYAEENSFAYDHARLECVAEPGPEATVTATLRYLTPDGEQRVELGPVPVPGRETIEFEQGRFTVRSEAPGDGVTPIRACVHNTSSAPTGLDRPAALRSSLISTHIVVKLSAGRFLSPLVTDCQSVNTFPVLATPNDDTILGAAIVLPDHPQLAPESRGNLFDNTEIEEALLLHVHTLTDDERGSVADPTVKAMLDKALMATPEDIVSLHGGLQEVDNNPGEDSATVDGVTFVKGSKLLLKPGADRDVYDRMLDGRSATLERIYIDYDNRVHLAVTVDDDPGQGLMRETGRYLFFFANEVQPL